MNKKNNILKCFVVVAIISIFIIFLNKQNYNTNDIKDYITSFGLFAPIIYIIMFALVPLTLFPDSILAISGGIIFGLFRGYIFTTIGALIGGSISFFIARILGREYILKISKSKFKSVEKIIKNNSFFIIFMLRLIPLFPFDIISYGAGISNIKFKDYIFATFLGTIPGIIVFTNIGAQWANIGSNSFYISIALLVLLFIISMVLKCKVIENKSKNYN